MEPRNLKDVEKTLKELLDAVNEAPWKTRSAKSTFISLSYFLTGNFKNNGLEYISQQECDLLRCFRELSPELKQLYISELRHVAATLKPLVRKLNTSASLPLEDLKAGMNIGANGNIYNLSCSHSHGYCYIGVDTNWKGFYKIGRTFDPSCKSRVSQSINPNYKIIYRTKDFYVNAGGLEEKIHQQLSTNRYKDNNFSEWFKLSDEELQTIIKDYDFIKLEDLLIKQL